MPVEGYTPVAGRWNQCAGHDRKLCHHTYSSIPHGPLLQPYVPSISGSPSAPEPAPAIAVAPIGMEPMVIRVVETEAMLAVVVRPVVFKDKRGPPIVAFVAVVEFKAVFAVIISFIIPVVVCTRAIAVEPIFSIVSQDIVPDPVVGTLGLRRVLYAELDPYLPFFNDAIADGDSLSATMDMRHLRVLLIPYAHNSCPRLALPLACYCPVGDNLLPEKTSRAVDTVDLTPAAIGHRTHRPYIVEPSAAPGSINKLNPRCPASA